MLWNRRHVLAVILLSSGLTYLTACGAPSSVTTRSPGKSTNLRLARVADSLQRPLVIEGQPIETWHIEERMRQFSVPGVSVAIIDEGRLAAADASTDAPSARMAHQAMARVATTPRCTCMVRPSMPTSAPGDSILPLQPHAHAPRVFRLSAQPRPARAR